MPTLAKRREELDMVEVYKILTGKSDTDPAIWFAKNNAAENGRLTRLAADPLNVRVPPARLEIRKNFFSVRVCEKWNSLPSAVKNARTVKQFKRALRALQDHQAQAT